MKIFLVLGKGGFVLAKCQAENQEQVVRTLEIEKDNQAGPLIFGTTPIGKFIYDQWIAHGQKIIEEQ